MEAFAGLLVLEVPEEGLTLADVQDVVDGEDVQIGVDGGQLDAFAVLERARLPTERATILGILGIDGGFRVMLGN